MGGRVRGVGIAEAIVCPEDELADEERVEVAGSSEEGVRLAQRMRAGQCSPVGIQLEKAEVGPTSGLTRGVFLTCHFD